jgi:hypothetical protein
MSTEHIIKRTFDAKKHPKGSDERAKLNCNAATSEYMTSYKYLVGWRQFRTRKDAEEYLNQLR